MAALFVYRDAIWGSSLLAPLDIPGTIFDKFRHMPRNASGIPNNHYIIDQVTFDLPVQTTVYEAWRNGEIPWWDPYTYAGRPLLADAHINGTDPVRILLYLTLPFEYAYNWTLILHSFICGLGLFVLLRHFRFANWICIFLALAWQYGGGFALWFGHPWIQAAFSYYPWLWLVWDKGVQGEWRRQLIPAALLIAVIFYAGNLQSHTYEGLFAMAFLFGYAGLNLETWRKTFPLVFFSNVAGACLAAPVLANQVEVFLIGLRTINVDVATVHSGGLMSLTGVLPWMMGTYRTLDLSKLVGSTSLAFGFMVFIGSAAFLLAGWAVWKNRDATRTPLRRTAMWLVCIYFVIVSTRLYNVFYSRSTGLPLLGFAVLAALGAEALCAAKINRRAGTVMLVLTLALAAGPNIVGFVIYPHYQEKVRQQLLEQQARQASLDSLPALRHFQVDNWNRESTFRNPEMMVAWLGVLLLGVLFWRPAWLGQPWSIPVLLLLNLLPVLMFYQRFMPRYPMAQWEQLKAGGPEQQRVLPLLARQPLRLYEKSPAISSMLFPNAMSHLYHIHTVHGYSAMQPRSLYLMENDARAALGKPIADYDYETLAGGRPTGILHTNFPGKLARFQWSGLLERPIQVSAESLNHIELAIGPGPIATLLWTDTYYPGWHAELDGKPWDIALKKPCFSRLEIPSGSHRLALHYRPHYLPFSLWLVAFAVSGLIAALPMKRETKAPMATP
ncbi:MAG: hypothetical protein WCO56_03730 [Verrucomicrobiota bacterium]